MNPSLRIAVIGGVGCGKTTFSRQLAEHLKLRHVDLDNLRYRPGWQRVPKAEFSEAVAGHVEMPEWLIDGNDEDARGLIWIRAGTVIWLDYPLRVVLWRLLRRTYRRLRTGETFANGNREQLGRLFGRSSIFLWAIQSHAARRQRYEATLALPRYAHLQVIRFRSPADGRAWLQQLRQGNVSKREIKND